MDIGLQGYHLKWTKTNTYTYVGETKIVRM